MNPPSNDDDGGYFHYDLIQKVEVMMELHKMKEEVVVQPYE